jgi:hypothetical protein
MSNPFSARGVTEQQYLDYGHEFFQMQFNLIDAAAEAKTAELANHVTADLRRINKKSSYHALATRFQQEFGGSFDAANNDEGFNDWLDQTGKRKTLTDAFSHGNVEGCLAIFREYAHVPEHQRPENVRASNREVMQQASDREYGTGQFANGGRGQGGAITRKEINNFYQDIARRHAFYNTPEGQKVKAQMDERIQHALQTGQVR